jgi:RNA polymerase sigma factor (sigma-70 family)
MTVAKFQSNYDQVKDVLFGFALKLTHNQEDAKDLVQETAVRAYVNRDKFKVGTNFKGWATTIMRNLFINQYRKKKKRKHVNESLDNMLFALENKNAISNTGETNMAVENILGMLDEVGEKYSVPFLMFFNGYEYQEIAEHLDIPMGTVKSRLFFVRKKMKKKINRNKI